MQQDELASLQRDSNLLKNDLFRECNVSLFENKTHKVLFDVGAGTCFLKGIGQLIDNLNAINTDPEDITDLIITHAHSDHLWGIWDDFEDITFPYANFQIGRKDWEFWTDPGTS